MVSFHLLPDGCTATAMCGSAREYLRTGITALLRLRNCSKAPAARQRLSTTHS